MNSRVCPIGSAIHPDLTDFSVPPTCHPCPFLWVDRPFPSHGSTFDPCRSKLQIDRFDGFHTFDMHASAARRRHRHRRMQRKDGCLPQRSSFLSSPSSRCPFGSSLCPSCITRRGWMDMHRGSVVRLKRNCRSGFVLHFPSNHPWDRVGWSNTSTRNTSQHSHRFSSGRDDSYPFHFQKRRCVHGDDPKPSVVTGADTKESTRQSAVHPSRSRQLHIGK